MPVPDEDQMTPPALLKVPVNEMDPTSPQSTWFDPASTVGVGSIVIVITSDSAGQPSFPVEVNVSVTLPVVISAGVGV